MRGTSRKWIALIAATCTLFVGLAVPSAYAEDATGQNATQNSATVDARSNESADTSETAKPTQDQKTESENGDQGNTTQDKDQSGTAQDEKGLLQRTPSLVQPLLMRKQKISLPNRQIKR